MTVPLTKMRPRHDTDFCDNGHRMIFFTAKAKCPLCEMHAYLEIVSSRLNETKAMLDHIINILMIDKIL